MTTRKRRPMTHTRQAHAGRIADSQSSQTHQRSPLPARLGRLLPLMAMLLALLAACAPGEAPPPGICDTYDRALFTTQLMGGASVLLGLALLGFRKNLAAILPSEGAQLGAVAASVGLGLVLLAFSTDIGNQILVGFGIDSLYTLCGLG